MDMTQTLERLSEISASLPEEMREGFESNVILDAETLVAELQAEAVERADEAMIGFREIERGEFLTMPQLRARLDAIKADIQTS